MTRLILCDENKVLKEEQKRLRLLRINQVNLNFLAIKIPKLVTFLLF